LIDTAYEKLEAPKWLEHPEQVKVRSIALFLPGTYQIHSGRTPDGSSISTAGKLIRKTDPDCVH